MPNAIEGKYCIFNYSEFPQLKDRAFQLFQYFENKYPKILQLVDLPMRERVNIVMKTLPLGPPAGKTGHSDIYLDPNQLDPKDLGVLVHEGTHVAQDFQDDNFENIDNKLWLIEGMANHVRLLLGWDGPNQPKFEPSKIKINTSLKEQRDYDVWAEFFKWLATKYSKGNLLVDFTNALKNSETDEAFLKREFGKSSGQLWGEFEGRVLFEQFKVKRELWIECLSGKDRNSIFNQIFDMVWNAAVFRVINEARKITAENEEGQKEINGMLHHFIDECFFDSQFLAIRRLTDPAYELRDAERGIFSLFALLNDMRKNIALFTRENFFAAEGLEYDYEAIEKREQEFIAEQVKNGQRVIWGPRDLDSWPIKLRHEAIDALSGVSAEQRKPSDVIQEKVLDCLIKILKDVSTDINLYVNKYIAHLATPQSREHYKADEVSITLGHLWNAYKVICQVANFVDSYMLTGASHSFLPVPQFNNFEFIEKSLVSYSNIEVLSKAWDDFSKETSSWGSWGLKELREQSGL
ncbi:MAG: basic secretory protein-like protein [Candidatus Omnitrophica bacterium]|nr:basic secretory protein-like protein [Candidatus Omnitrophota bacterium]MDD5592253.1 basic secretory protein-like protein [Candidatus Omnitrophota bacterium]